MGRPTLMGWDVCILSYISMKYYRWKKAVKKNLPSHKTEDYFEVFKIISTCHAEQVITAYMTWSQITALSMANLTLKQLDYKEWDQYVLVLWGGGTENVLTFKDVSSVSVGVSVKMSVWKGSPLPQSQHLFKTKCPHWTDYMMSSGDQTDNIPKGFTCVISNFQIFVFLLPFFM